MKKILALVLALVMALGLVACGDKGGEQQEGGTPNTTGEEKVVKIGVFEPLTGDNGAGGKQEVLGMQYANYVQPTVDINGETYQVQLEVVDNRTAAENGPSAAAELVNKGVSIVLGSYGSGVSMAGGTVFAEAGVPAIGVTCTNPQVTSDCDVYFRICFLDPFQGTVLANYAYNELGYRTAYTLAENGNDYDEGLAHYFTEAFTTLGGKVENANFPENTSDFNSYITNAVNAGAEVIFAPTSTSYAQLIVEQAAAKGVKATIMAGDTWDSNQILAAAKGKDIDIQVTTFYQEGGNKAFDEGFKAFLEGSEQNLTDNGGDSNIAAVSAMGYDAYFVALEALKAAGSTDRAKVTEALWKVSTTGVTGAIAFDDVNGDAIRTTAYIKKVNTTTGLWDFVKEQGVAK